MSSFLSKYTSGFLSLAYFIMAASTTLSLIISEDVSQFDRAISFIVIVGASIVSYWFAYEQCKLNRQRRQGIKK